jgi:hypothetical protein
LAPGLRVFRRCVPPLHSRARNTRRKLKRQLKKLQQLMTATTDREQRLTLRRQIADAKNALSQLKRETKPKHVHHTPKDVKKAWRTRKQRRQARRQARRRQREERKRARRRLAARRAAVLRQLRAADRRRDAKLGKR